MQWLSTASHVQSCLLHMCHCRSRPTAHVSLQDQARVEVGRSKVEVGRSRVEVGRPIEWKMEKCS